MDPKRYLSHEKHHQEDLSGGIGPKPHEYPGFGVEEEEAVEEVTRRLREPEARGDDFAQAYEAPAKRRARPKRDL